MDFICRGSLSTVQATNGAACSAAGYKSESMDKGKLSLPHTWGAALTPEATVNMRFGR